MKNSAFFPGIVFVLIGVIFFGRNMGWIDYSIFRVIISWPMLLIVIGVGTILRKHLVGGLIVTGIGTFFLLSRIDVIWACNVHDYWPLLFVCIGIILLLKRPFDKKRHHTPVQETVYSSENGFVYSDVSFGSVKQIVVDPVFKGAKIKNSCGSTLIDLRRTSLESPETYIDVECRLGGIEIYAPNTWVIISKASCDFGGIEDNRFRTELVEFDNSRKVIIRGKIVLGGMEIKN
ncbi:hypothetical protein EZS27_010332 [termite gut metagenome]|uniref:LiaF transmembrane domain-containing protein n=1 Tax=termite gut metagenome TaxID=433724 RepID=A0A5J4S6Z4_9ZZZZ